MKSEEISARFGGRDIVFAIHRSVMPIFEAIHGPASLMAARLTSRAWTVEDVRAVLEFALIPASQLQRYARFPAPLPKTMLPHPDPHISATLIDRGPGGYAELALLILVASLFGLKEDESNAFSDGSTLAE